MGEVHIVIFHFLIQIVQKNPFILFNPFHATNHLIYPLKTSENFSDALKGYRNGLLARDGLV